MPGKDENAIHDNVHENSRPYGNADFIGYFGLTWLFKPTYNMKEHSRTLAPLEAATVIIRGINVDEMDY